LDRNGFKSSEFGFDTNETNPFLSILIHFRLLGDEENPKIDPTLPAIMINVSINFF